MIYDDLGESPLLREPSGRSFFEKGGASEMIEQFINFVIRPPRFVLLICFFAIYDCECNCMLEFMKLCSITFIEM